MNVLITNDDETVAWIVEVSGADDIEGVQQQLKAVEAGYGMDF